MLVPVLWFIVGLVLLIKGGDWFVDASTNIAHHFHIPELLIGATIVSIGTTLPEVMVSATSAVSGHGEIAYGNALGSIICNSALIAAITIAVKPGKADKKALKTPLFFFFLSMIFYSGTAIVTGCFSRITGILLVLIFLIYMTMTVKQMKGVPTSSTASKDSNTDNASAASKEESMTKSIVMLVIGAALIAFGADLLVDNGTLIAAALGVPESVIALTFVALGTSLPELTTAITSLIKGHGALSLGNIIGANLFNLVLVTGISATLSPFSIPTEKTLAGINATLIVDIPVAFLVMLILSIPPLIKGKLYRSQGIAMLIIYAAFIFWNFCG